MRRKTKKRILTAAVLIIILVAVIMTYQYQTREPDKASNETPSYDYSAGRTHYGYWEGLTALNYVEMFGYHGLSIPFEFHSISDEFVDMEIMYLLDDTPPFENHITSSDAVVKDGDKINIDYVGVLTGDESHSSNVSGTGEDFYVGMTEVVEGIHFFELIGKSPGDTVDIEVEFPDDYEVIHDWAGRTILYTVEINYIAERREMNDDDVKEIFFELHGWETVSEMREKLHAYLRNESINDYIKRYFEDEVVVKEIPSVLMERVEQSMIEWHENEATNRGETFLEFMEFLGVENGVEGLLEFHREENTRTARIFLIIQAIAEDMELKVSDEDLAEYMNRNNVENHDEEIERYGVPMLKQLALQHMVLEYIIDNAVYEDEKDLE
jgi:trigger factor